MTAPTGPILDKRTPAQLRDSLITEAARRHGVPLQLALAVSHVENTRGLPAARGAAGEVGLMQIMPQVHGFNPKALEDPAVNVNFGVRLLRSLFERHKSWEQAIRAFNGATDNPTAGDAYVNKVRAAMRRINATKAGK